MKSTIRVMAETEGMTVSRFRHEVARLVTERTGERAAVDVGVDGLTLVAVAGGRVVGSVDLHVGRLDEVPAARAAALGAREVAGGAPVRVAVFDETTVHPDHDETDLELRLLAHGVAQAAARGVRWVLSTCVPAEIGAYRALGFRPCAAPLTGAGVAVAVPVALDLFDAERLQGLRSPFLRDAGTARRAAEAAADAAMVSSGQDAITGREARAADAVRVAGAVRTERHAFLDAIDGALRADLLGGAARLTLRLGERLAARGEAGNDPFLVARGAVEVRRGAVRLAVLGPGELVGEMAFVLEGPRTADLVAATDDVVVVRIDGERLAALVKRDPVTGARIWRGISQALAVKLASAGV
jgi:CRP-like cAMP-binding protein